MVRPPSLNLRWWLNVLVLATAIPLLVFALAALVWQGRAERRSQLEQAARVAEDTMQSVDRYLAGAITGLQVLGASPSLRTGDFASFHAQASTAVGITGDSVIILYEADGSRIVSTAVPFGTPLPPRRDMSAIGVPFSTRKPHVTKLFLSETAREPTLGVIVPVLVDGEVRYVLGAGLLARTLTALLPRPGLSSDWIVTVLDEDGTIIARSLRPNDAIGKKAMPQNWARITAADTPSGSFEGATQEGARFLLSFSKSATSGWTTVVGVPAAALTSETRWSAYAFIAIGTLVVALALLFAWRTAMRIYRATDALTRDARGLEQGAAVELSSTGIEQFDRLKRAMHMASIAIREREGRLSRAVDELQQAHASLREEKDQKDRFIAVLAHELRNPMAPIRTGAQLLRRNPPREVAHRTLEMMERQIGHMVRLIDDLLDVSRISRGKITLQKAPVDLHDVITESVEATDGLFQAKKQQLTIKLPNRPLPLEADRTRLAQALSNLLINASKFTPERGQVLLAVECSADEIVVSVQDDGIGIPPERLQDVFGLFTQLKHDNHPGSPGLGIGLAISRLLVELHGGNLEARSEGPGHGATFVMRLPARGTRAPAADGPTSPLPAADRKSVV